MANREKRAIARTGTRLSTDQMVQTDQAVDLAMLLRALGSGSVQLGLTRKLGSTILNITSKKYITVIFDVLLSNIVITNA